jgi:hypothetical protein
MYHIRAIDSTPSKPTTICGAEPEYTEYPPSESHQKMTAARFKCEVGDLQFYRSPKLVDWAMVSKSNMDCLCKDCVLKCQPLGKVKLADIKADLKLAEIKADLKKLSEEEDFIPF